LSHVRKTDRRCVLQRGPTGSIERNRPMADNASAGSNSGLYFIVGALVVALLGVIFYLTGAVDLGIGGKTQKVDITIEAPKTK
jgi:hypothetical protein